MQDGLPPRGDRYDGPSSSVQAIANYVSASAIIIGAFEMVPLIVLIWNPQEVRYAPYFIAPSLIVMVLAYLLRFTRADKRARTYQLTDKEAAACTFLIWVIGIIAYSAPFVLAGRLGPIQALFESTSGLTTTGLTLIDPDGYPHILLLHRSLMQYIGDVGLVLVLTSVVANNRNLKVYNTEAHTDRLLPGTVATARAILCIYTAIALIGILAYILTGMDPFDAVTTALSAISTGGFSTHSFSIAFYDSIAVEAITIVLMLLGCTNFLLLFLLLRRRFRSVLTHIETRAMFGVIVLSTVAIALLFCQSDQMTFLHGLRLALFQVISVLSSCGYQTIPSFSDLDSSIILILIALMFIGAMAGSTAGGIKLYRFIIAMKGLFWNFQERFGGSDQVYCHRIDRFGKRTICTEKEIRDAEVYIVTYVMIFMVGCFIFSLCGASMQEAAFDFASCLGNTGVGSGFIDCDSGPVELCVASIGMLLGRLEIIPVFAGIAVLSANMRRQAGYGK